MNEGAVLEKYRMYHQQMTDHYGRLLEALGALESLGGHTGEPNGSAPALELRGGKQRVPKEERVPLPIRAKRMAAGVTAKQLAERLGLSANYVGQVESGAQKARAEVPQHWEAVLDDMIAERARLGEGGGNE